MDDQGTRTGLTVVEAARIAGVGRSSIYEELSAGRLAAVKLGRRTIITARALNDWLATLPAYKPLTKKAA